MDGTETPPASWDEQFSAEPASVAEMRRALAAFARAHGADDTLLGDLQLAVSEAATNAVVHAFVGTTPGTIRIRARPGAGTFDVLVSDDGAGMVPRGDSPGLGLGLPTIAQLTTRLDIRAGAGGRGTEVHMEFAAPGVQGPPPDERPALLGEVARLAGTGWPAEGVERLLELLVPSVADAGAIDLVEAGGPQRVAERGTQPPPRTPADPLDAPLGADAVRVEPISSGGLAHWVTIPLTESGVLLGTLGLGLSAGRGDPHTDVAFFQALGERAARGLAAAHLVDELRRTRRRLERILSVLSEAVTVQDRGGRTVYANDAAVDLLGAANREEILTAPPGELAGRFDITLEDGRPVTHADLPGDRVLAGEPEAQLLTRSIRRDTGAERWLLTKATLLEDGEPFAVNIIEDITDAKNAELRRRLLAEVALVLAEVRGRDAQLQRIATLAVPALAEWCAIDVGDERAAEHGAVPSTPRSTLACPIGGAGTLHLQTRARLLEDDHRVFAADLARRLAPALSASSA
jgi:PAS domain S-box-containing protein